MSMGDRTFVVTGGTGALGTAVVEVLLREGARVHVPVLESQTPAGFAFADHERVKLTHGVDLSSEAQVVAYYAGVPSLWGSIHIAGGFAMMPISETSLAELERLWRMNFVSCFLCCREAVARIRAREGEGGGRIVNVAARPALVPTAGMLAYTTSKAGVVSLTVSLAEELASERIWVNAIAPSVIDTPANRAAVPKADHSKWPKPSELAELIVQLASPSNACARGAVVPVYGRA